MIPATYYIQAWEELTGRTAHWLGEVSAAGGILRDRERIIARATLVRILRESASPKPSYPEIARLLYLGGHSTAVTASKSGWYDGALASDIRKHAVELFRDAAPTNARIYEEIHPQIRARKALAECVQHIEGMNADGLAACAARLIQAARDMGAVDEPAAA